jgi:hypothetical protein
MIFGVVLITLWLKNNRDIIWDFFVAVEFQSGEFYDVQIRYPIPGYRVNPWKSITIGSTL